MSKPARSSSDGKKNGNTKDAGASAGTLAGSSGHTRCRKARFAATLSSTFIAYTLGGSAKDFYIEKLAAQPIAMGVIFFIVSFIAAMNEAFSGRLQNREALKFLFPVEKWGRKAPWLLTHTVILAVACAAIFIPPRDKVVLHVWFMVVSILMFWGVSTCIIAFESCRQELYPYNEERAGLEVMCKFGCIVGIGYSALPMLVLLAQSTFLLRLAASVFFAFGTLAFGLQALPVWLEARSTNAGMEEQAQSNLLADFRDTWRNIAFRHLLAVRMYDGLYQGIQATNLLYYLTYILQLKGAERSAWIVLVGLCSTVGDMGVAVIVGRLMRERRNSYRIQDYVATMRAIDAVTTIILLAFPLLLPGSHALTQGRSLFMERMIFITWSMLNRAFQSPFSFWRVGAQCWIVDEDIHSGDGLRREAKFISAGSATQNFSRAFAAAVSFLGYGLCGLQPVDCEGACRGAEAGEGCWDDCMQRSIFAQPEGVRWYIRLLYIGALAVLELLLVYHVVRFPIKGIRLARLYNNQTLACGGEVDSGNAVGQIRKLKSSPTLQHIMDVQRGKAVLVADGGVPESIARAMNHKKGTKVSASVVFQDALQAIRAEGPDVPISSTARMPSSVPLVATSHPASMMMAGARSDGLTGVGCEHSKLPSPLVFPTNMLRCCPYMGPWRGRLYNCKDGRLTFIASNGTAAHGGPERHPGRADNRGEPKLAL